MTDVPRKRLSVNLVREGLVEEGEDRPLELSMLDLTLPCRRFVVEHKVAEVGKVSVTAENTVSQPGALSGGQTAGVANAQIDIKQDGAILANLRNGASLADVVKALNSIGANPQDLIAILQAMKTAGALRAELEII